MADHSRTVKPFRVLDLFRRRRSLLRKAHQSARWASRQTEAPGELVAKPSVGHRELLVFVDAMLQDGLEGPWLGHTGRFQMRTTLAGESVMMSPKRLPSNR